MTSHMSAKYSQGSNSQSVLTEDKASLSRNNALLSLYNEQNKLKMSLKKKKTTQETIFYKICSRNDFKDSEICAVCGKKFGMNLFVKVKKHCKFCGNCVCDEHALKRRCDPENKKNFLRICDICEMKYLYRMLNQDFNDQKKKLDQEIKDLQWQNDTIFLDVQKNQNILDELKYQKDGKDKEFTKKVTTLSNEITKLEDLIRKYEKEIINITRNTKTTDNEIEQTKDLYEKLLKETEILKSEEKETYEKINAITLDIQQTEQQIDEIDKKMADANMRKKLLTDQKDSNSNNYYSEESLMEEDKRNNEGSLISRAPSVFKDANHTNDVLNNKSVVYNEDNNEILVQIKKKKPSQQDENVKKMDKSCDVCNII